MGLEVMVAKAFEEETLATVVERDVVTMGAAATGVVVRLAEETEV